MKFWKTIGSAITLVGIGMLIPGFVILMGNIFGYDYFDRQENASVLSALLGVFAIMVGGLIYGDGKK